MGRPVVLLACVCAQLVFFVQVVTAQAGDPPAAPAVTIAAPASPVAGSPAAITATLAGDPAPVATSYAWSGDDAAFADTAAAETSVTFAHGGAHTVTVTVQTDDGRALTATADVAVRAADPVVAVAGPDAATTDQPVQLAAQASGGSGDVEAVAWDLDGDGGYDDASGAEITTAFPAAGTATPRARVTTADGGTGEGSRSIAVASGVVADPPPAPASPVAASSSPPKAVVATVVLAIGRIPAARRATVLKRGLTVPLQVATGGPVTVTLAVSGAVARRLHVASATIATKRVSIGPGATETHIRIPKVLRRGLSRLSRFTLTIAARRGVARSVTSVTVQ